MKCIFSRKTFFLLLPLFFLFAFCFNAYCFTYYIDYETGVDANDGRSISSPWKRSPGMKGFSGSYSHTAGDRFVFKGGVTWPSVVLPMTIAYSGAPGNPDIYTSDKSWYKGTSWTRPVFDGENTIGNYMGIIESSNKQYFTLEYIRITGAGIEGATDDNSYGLKITGSGLSGVTIQHMQLVPYSKSNLVLSACGGGVTTTGLVIQYNDFEGAMNNIEMGCTDNTSTVDGMIIRGNNFSRYTQNSPTDHPDGIHLHNKSGALRRFSNVVISGNNFFGIWKTKNTAQIYFEDSVSSARIFDNLFSFSNTTGAGSYIFSPGHVAIYGCNNIQFYNNTINADAIGGYPNYPLSGIIFSTGLSNYAGAHSVYENSFSGVRHAVMYNPSMNLLIDRNTYNVPTDGRSSVGTWDANGKLWSAWQEAGNDLNGFSNPYTLTYSGQSNNPSEPSTNSSAFFPRDGGGGCFIATAAYGSYLDPNVKSLRHFRDDFLLNNRPGRFFVRLYYHYSPPIASVIAQHDVLRFSVRWFILSPLIFIIVHPYLFIMFALLIFSALFLIRRRRRRHTIISS